MIKTYPPTSPVFVVDCKLSVSIINLAVVASVKTTRVESGV